jgi:hypothetical protein
MRIASFFLLGVEKLLVLLKAAFDKRKKMLKKLKANSLNVQIKKRIEKRKERSYSK